MATLEAAGVIVVAENCEGSGVRLRKTAREGGTRPRGSMTIGRARPPGDEWIDAALIIKIRRNIK